MSFNFEQPDDPFNWWPEKQQDSPQIRGADEMLRCLDEAFDLVSALTEDLGYPAGMLDHCDVRDDSDATVLLPLPNEFLRLLDSLQLAVSVTLVQAQAAFPFDGVGPLIVELGFPTKPESACGATPPVESSCIRVDSGDNTSHCCRGCHEFIQNSILWQKALSSFSQKPDDMSPATTEGPETCHAGENALVPASLGTETNTIYVVYDGKQFRSVPEAETSGAKNARRHSSAADSVSQEPGRSQESGNRVLNRCNEPMWGPHWVNRQDDDCSNSKKKLSETESINQADSACNPVFPRRAGRHRALPENVAARSRLRSIGAKCHCLRCNATPETCRGVRPFSHNTEECRDKRSCRVPDPKGDP